MLKSLLQFKTFYRLKDSNFSIISDDCWGGEVYKELELPFRSPFIGLFINPEDYLKLLLDLRSYLKEDLIFIESNSTAPGEQTSFHTALLKDIKINFMHNKSEDEAAVKWERRVARINWDNLFFKIDFNRPEPYGYRK